MRKLARQYASPVRDCYAANAIAGSVTDGAIESATNCCYGTASTGEGNATDSLTGAMAVVAER